MDTAQRVERILSNTYIKNDCYKRLLILQQFLEETHYSPNDQHDTLTELIQQRFRAPADHAHAVAIAAWGEDFLGSFKTADLRSDITTIKNTLASLPELTLYVPVLFEPPQIATIAAWCRNAINPQVVLDIRVDPETGGGCMIVWKSVLYDFSLRRRIRQHADEIKQVLENISAPAPQPQSV